MKLRFPLLLLLASFLMGASPVPYVYNSTWSDGSPRAPLVPARLDTSMRGPKAAPILGTDTAGKLIPSPIVSGDTVKGSLYGVHGGNISTGLESVAFGYQSTSSASASFAGGVFAKSQGLGSLSYGNSTWALGDVSFVGGWDNRSRFGQTVFGKNALVDSLSDALPTVGQKIFKLGWGTDNSHRNDVFSVTDSGKIIVPINNIPATSSSPGIAGTMVLTNLGIYVCVATNTWKFSPLLSF